MTVGLILYILMIGTNALGLLVDLVLLLTGHTTITRTIETSHHCAEIVAVLLLWIIIGACGFVHHFLSR